MAGGCEEGRREEGRREEGRREEGRRVEVLRSQEGNHGVVLRQRGWLAGEALLGAAQTTVVVASALSSRAEVARSVEAVSVF